MVTQFEKDEGLPQSLPFDFQLAMDRLRHFKAPRDKLGHLCAEGALVRVRKGLFVPGWRRGGEPPVDPLVLSDLIYGPSYVSYETALAHYGLIPERVEEITCATSKRARQFRTPVGRYEYRPVPERVFPCGLRIETARGGHYLIAEPEKALCDRIALVSALSAARDVPALLVEDLRLESDAVLALRLPLVAEIARLYRRKSVAAFHRWLARATKTLPAAA